MNRTSFYSKLRELFDEKVALKLAEAIEEEFLVYDKLATKDDLREIREVLRELSVSQKNSEQRFAKIEENIAELAEAQKKTEERLAILEQKMAELAEAQKKTEERLNELAEAQKETEKKLAKLTGVVEDIKDELGNISHTVGHTLEDKAIIKLPKILKEKYGIEINNGLKRGFLENKRGEEEEINIFGFGTRNGEKIFIIGEGKARFGKGDLKDFLKKIERYGEIYGKPFPIIITYVFSKKEVEEKVKELKICYFLSYQLEKY